MAKDTTLAVGVIGCGNISKAYMELAPLFRGIRMVACADMNPDAAKARAAEFNLGAMDVDGLLASDQVDVIVNLTVPAAHFEISRRAIEAGKHVYSEKPFVLSLQEGETLRDLAAEKGVRVGSAPDTFLGGAHQQARQIIDDGVIGKVTSGTAHVMGRGMEHWHPNPDFFFLKGAGPVLDMGPYYVTNLIQLIGPVRRVMAMSATPQTARTILSEPRKGETVPVETPTTIHALLEFHSGAVITFGASWDVQQNGHAPMELYGESGTLHVPDPNWFNGELAVMRDGEAGAPLPEYSHPFGIANFTDGGGAGRANYRTAGLAEMAMAILEHRPHRCALELALHAVDVMTSILRSAEIGGAMELATTCARPAPLTAQDAADLLRPV